MKTLEGFQCHRLDGQHTFWVGRLPQALVWDAENFQAVWQKHPSEYHMIKIHGRLVKTPRWQQAFGMDYHYTGRVNRALPVPSILEPLLSWAKQSIDADLNGILVNWYDGALGHYIGRHRDSRVNMVTGAPIVTVSFGEERVFRLRPWRDAGQVDFQAQDGTVFVMPYETNLYWTHEVPASTRYTGRRISVTLRAFAEDNNGLETVSAGATPKQPTEETLIHEANMKNTKNSKKRTPKAMTLLQQEVRKAMEEIIPVLVQKGFLPVARVESVSPVEATEVSNRATRTPRQDHREKRVTPR